MKKTLIILFFILLIRPAIAQAYINVSIIDLIANPEKFKDKTVLISGYYQYEDAKTYAGRYIYLTREYAALWDNGNRITLAAKGFDKTDGKNTPSNIYVKIIGVVDTYDDDDKGSKSAYIKEIYRITGYVTDSAELSQEKPEGAWPRPPPGTKREAEEPLKK